MNVKEKVYEIVKKIYDPLANEFGTPNEITDETTVLNASGIDEELQREFVMALEEVFDLDIVDEDAEKLYTIGDVITYLEDKVKKEPEKKEGENV